MAGKAVGFKDNTELYAAAAGLTPNLKQVKTAKGKLPDGDHTVHFYAEYEGVLSVSTGETTEGRAEVKSASLLTNHAVGKFIELLAGSVSAERARELFEQAVREAPSLSETEAMELMDKTGIETVLQVVADERTKTNPVMKYPGKQSVVFKGAVKHRRTVPVAATKDGTEFVDAIE